MFHFFKKSNSNNAFEFLGVDMHSHLLPAVDDGSQSLEQSLYFIEELNTLGFSKLITTPHIYPDFYPNTPATLTNAYNQILEVKQINDTFNFAAEYFVDDAMLSSNQLLTFGKKYILIEVSFVALPMNFEQFIFELITQNYIPVLAHPERYLYLAGNTKFFNKIIEMGCLLQLNINSLVGYYGKPSEEIAWQLFDKNLVHFLGTDLHHQRHLDALKATAKKGFMKKLRKYNWLNSELL